MATQWEQLIMAAQQDPALMEQIQSGVRDDRQFVAGFDNYDSGIASQDLTAANNRIQQANAAGIFANSAPAAPPPAPTTQPGGGSQFDPAAPLPQFTQAGMPGNNPPLNPFQFGPSTANPQGRMTGASPEINQMQDLNNFITALQNPAQRMQLITTLGASAPAPTDEQLSAFQKDFTAPGYAEGTPGPTQQK